MKVLLYVFAFVWFLIGLGALIGGQQIGMGILQGGTPSVSEGTISDAATLGWFWLWTFPMPALLAGALGAVLGRLDEIRDVIELANEQDMPDEGHPDQEGRVDPYIGENYLEARPDRKSNLSGRNHTLF